MNKIGLIIAVLGVAGVALGALGAHALAERLAEAGMTRVWETAVIYHLTHTVALLALAGRQSPGPGGRAGQVAAGCWIAGVLAFSGSLYLLALGGPRWLGPVTPLGGVALMVGWGAAGWSLWRGGRAA
jgi:uncharacterized membrane protein YgdD (TMEM256/DUF423 family)